MLNSNTDCRKPLIKGFLIGRQSVPTKRVCPGQQHPIRYPICRVAVHKKCLATLHKGPEASLHARDLPHLPIVDWSYPWTSQGPDKTIWSNDSLPFLTMHFSMARIDSMLSVIVLWTAKPSKGAIHKTPNPLPSSLCLNGTSKPLKLTISQQGVPFKDILEMMVQKLYYIIKDSGQPALGAPKELHAGCPPSRVSQPRKHDAERHLRVRTIP